MLVAFSVPADTHEFDPDKAYILIRATVADPQAKQPTWIALKSGLRLEHIPAGKSLVSIAPGTYRLKHIEFGQSPVSQTAIVRSNSNSGPRVRTVHMNSKAEIILEAGKLHMIGDFVITETSKRDKEIIVSDPKVLIRIVCNKMPEVFNRFLLRNFIGEEPRAVICSND